MTVIPFPNSGHSIRTSPERSEARAPDREGDQIIASAPDREGARISAEGLSQKTAIKNQLLQLSVRLTEEAKALPVGHPRRAAIENFIDDAAKACGR